MVQRVLLSMVAAMLPMIATAEGVEKYRCTFGELERRVEIAHEPGVEVPCSVHYYKDTEAPGEQQVLWSADSDPHYCRSKTEEFVAKLEGWGWNCNSATDAAPPEADAEDMPETEYEQEPVAIEASDELVTD